jgi:osmotically-inducible protein OsmY
MSSDEKEEWFMAMSEALLFLPAPGRAGEENDAVDATTVLLMQALEDLRLADQVEHALRATGYAPLRGVEVTVQSRLAILRGRVPSNYLKQVAQEAAQAVPGVRQVRNDLVADRPS